MILFPMFEKDTNQPLTDKVYNVFDEKILDEIINRLKIPGQPIHITVAHSHFLNNCFWGLII